jgi:hypothetical protein
MEVTHSKQRRAIYYKAVFGKLAAEILFFGEDGKVNRSIANYNEI